MRRVIPQDPTGRAGSWGITLLVGISFSNPSSSFIREMSLERKISTQAKNTDWVLILPSKFISRMYRAGQLLYVPDWKKLLNYYKVFNLVDFFRNVPHSELWNQRFEFQRSLLCFHLTLYYDLESPNGLKYFSWNYCSSILSLHVPTLISFNFKSVRLIKK